MQRATGRASGLVVAMLASCSWLAGCAQQQMAHPPAVPSAPSAGAPSASGQPSSTSGSESAPPSKSAATAGQEATGAAGEAEGQEGSETAGAGAAAQTPDEQRDGLDQTLQASLGAFDAMLLKEQVEAAARRAEHGTGAGGGSGAGGEGEGSGEGEGGGAAGSSGSGAGGAAGSEASTGEKRSGGQDKEARGTESKGGSGDKDRATGSSGAREPREGGRVVTGDPEGNPPTGGGADDARVPEDVGDGRDDDVVARQLREAAMSEEDPAIREKLWDEYRRYKRGES